MKTNDNDGITLVSLIVTMIVLLILAGIMINTFFSTGSILTKTEEAKIANDEAKAKDFAEQMLTYYLQEYYSAKIVTKRIQANDPNMIFPDEYILEQLSGLEKNNYKFTVKANNRVQIYSSTDGKGVFSIDPESSKMVNWKWYTIHDTLNVEDADLNNVTSAGLEVEIDRVGFLIV